MSIMRNSMMRLAVGAFSAGAMIVGTVAPAAARHNDYRGGYYSGYGYSSAYRNYRPYKHYRHRRGPSAGEVIGIAALIGAVAIIASSASKDKKSRRTSDDRPDYRRDEDYRSDSRLPGSDAPSRYALDEDAAIDACVAAARDKAEAKNGGYAEILDIARPRERGNGEWDIEGRLEQRRSYSDKQGETKRFSCDVREGRVAYVYISRDAA